MVKRNIIILSAVLLLLAGSGLALDQDVAGEWEITSEGRQGPQTQAIKIVQDGEKITVTMEGRGGETTGEGTIKDNKIEWKITRETQRGEFTSTYTGTVDGDTMSGTMQMSMGERPPTEWTAKKK
ncbi:MAG: hypothetical protein MUP98_08815 [Candidatus Aminicenantes bacterium]|nr:hypothetical protein [Candidatus Aminicenantes bacterium]